MSGNPSSIFDGYFQGTVEESRARLPEQVVDDAIKAMSLDPEQDVENGHHGTLKEWVWDWLVSLIASYGGPGPTEIETTPKMLQKKAQADAKKLREAADVLRNLTYESLYSSNGTQSRAAISHSLRRASLPKEGPRAFHGQHAAKYHHERFGVWPVLYPFDVQLDDVIDSLERMISYHETFLEEVTPQVKGRGEAKEGKERFDTLISGLCGMYEQLTGKPATSYPKPDGTVSGNIIPFLQVVLPHAQYTGGVSAAVLQKKVMRLLASPGDIAPSSRTSIGWGRQSDWPIKPEIVMEGGNWVTDGTNVDRNDDLCLLTTARTGVFSTLADTSAACAQASRLAAILHAQYPDLWPESVRGLLVHRAAWTEGILAGSAMADLSMPDKIQLMRKFGYGQPNERCAAFSASNRACIIIQDTLQPFTTGDDGNVVLNEMHLHKLPWPSEAIRAVPGSVKVRIKLSYYIEPNPSDRLPDGKYAYASHGLRFELKGPTENMDTFRARVNKLERDDAYQNYYRANWLLGSKARNHGSIISDIWEGTGAEFAEQDAVVVFPTGGWWKYRKFLQRYNEKVRYSLIVTLESEDAEIDIYSEIENIIATRVATTVATPV